MNANDVIEGLGGRKDFYARTPGFDSDRAKLSPNEMLLYARAGKGCELEEILAACQLSEPEAVALLKGLKAKGAIQPSGAPPPRPEKARNNSPVAASPSSAAVPAATASNPAEPPDSVDLPAERQREILALEAKLDSADHFEILGLRPDADPAAIKNAYHRASMAFHPDRYFQKNLGSFRTKLERIFRKVSEAHATLSDDARRLAYLRANPVLLRAAGGAAPVDPALTEEQGRARAAERRARLHRHPYLAKAAKVSDLVSRAQGLMASGEMEQATSQLNTALQLDPHATKANELLSETRRRAEGQRAKEALTRGKDQANRGDTMSALASYRTALTADPTLVEAAMQAAMLLIRMGDQQEARVMAQKALSLAPKRAAAHVILGQVQLELGQKKAAKLSFEEALKLDPANEEAKKQLKKLRWVF